MSTANPETAPAEPGQSRLILAALCIAAFLAALNFMAASPFYREIARDLNTTVPLLGQVVTLMVLISAGLGLMVGPFADLHGYRRPLVFGLLTIAANLLGTALAPSYLVLLLLSVVGGLGDAVVFGLALAMAGVCFEGDERRRAISWTIASLSSGAIVGIPVLTLIGDSAGWRVAIAAGGIASLVATWFIANVLPPDARRPASRFRIQSMVDAYSPLRGSPSTMRLLEVTVLRAIWFFGMLTYLGAFLSDDLELGTSQIGFVYTLGGVGASVGSFVAGARFMVVPGRILIAVTNLVAATLLLPMLWVGTVAVSLPLLFVIACSSAMSGVATATLLATESPAAAGTTMAFNGSLLNVGAAAGAAIGGLWIAIGGYDGLAIGLPIFALAAATLVLWPLPQTAPAEKHR